MELGACRPRRGHGDAPAVCPCLCPQLLAVQPQHDVSVTARRLSEGPAPVRLLLRVQREGWQRVQRDARAVRVVSCCAEQLEVKVLIVTCKVF